ncbi:MULTISPECIES: hypothetical protein [Photorhabdus]|uniref:hypothetical protein n=1 Tax=Photorhabdus TaxID=29487 RepID=UPI000DCCED01|nr:MULTISPECIES: hypothetical protein [Photorhabdus]MCC8373928.1 hypothetical protein [Photorhabdus bodei]MCT8350939.1 hypothetical protein [Photorhabdus kayaii]MDB6367417.1 hypothetical protein [Photorhabdus bodei]RAX12385.1 hypothetical protein CKY10_00690 [Photorhabdus sp. HUG-39]
MISNNKEAYVWIWLPEQTEPVVAGRLEEFNGRILFNYGKSLETAHNFNISEKKAKEIFNKQISIIQDNWNSICEEAELSEIDKKLL